MPDQTEVVAPSPIEATYKAREVEGFVDIHFYRKIGFRIAQYFAQRNVSPATVTLLGGAFGIVAGHFYYYRDLRINLLGIVFHIVANALDNADGQLARILNQQSRFGRLLDGVVDHVIWLSIYFHLALRHVASGGSPWIWLVAAVAALSHGMQAATADYCRNGYRYFVKGRIGADFDSSSGLENDSRQLTWRGAALEKLFLIFYSHVTRRQEVLVPRLKQVRETVDRDFPEEIPAWLQSRYQTTARPVLKWCGWLMTNARIFLLFFLFVIAAPTWFFWIEITIFNALLAYVIFQQQEISESLLELLERRPDAT
jgi:hypothetical protein